MARRVQNVYGRDVSAGPFGPAAVQLSGVAGRGEWTRSTARKHRDWSSVSACGRRYEPRADQFHSNLGPPCGWMDLGRCGGFSRFIALSTTSHPANSRRFSTALTENLDSCDEQPLRRIRILRIEKAQTGIVREFVQEWPCEPHSSDQIGRRLLTPYSGLFYV